MNFKQWYRNNFVKITWFLIGFLTLAGLQSLGRGDYVNAVISFGLIALNLFINRK